MNARLLSTALFAVHIVGCGGTIEEDPFPSSPGPSSEPQEPAALPSAAPPAAGTQARIAPEPEMSRVVQVAAGDRHTCALTADGDVFCWGDNRLGQSGVDPAVARAVARPTFVTGRARSLAAAGDYTCASGDTVVCWGSNSRGQLGSGSREPAFRHTPAPVRIDTLRTFTAGATLAVGRDHACAIEREEIHCWGNGMDGQLGLGYLRLELPYAMPVSWVEIKGARLASGSAHTCAMLADGRAVACWGANAAGELGGGSRTEAAPPAPVRVALPARAVVSNVVSGDRHTCAVVDDRVMCWGKNGSGQTGALESPYEATPRLVAALDQWKVAGLAAGGDTTCVIREGGAVHCFGSNRYGQLGQAPDETPWPAGFPVRVPGGATSIAVGLTHVCAATGEGRVHCWGANGAHQFGR